MKHLSAKLNKQMFKLLSLVGTVLTLASCGGTTNVPPPLPPSGDSTAPSIVSITPKNGAVGVRKDSNIVITFSEAMDKARTEQAFQSTDIEGFSFSWSDDSTVLTVDPSSDLSYSCIGKVYSFGLTSGAADLAGNTLQALVGSSFATLIRKHELLYSVASEDGSMSDGGAINVGFCGGEAFCVGDAPPNYYRGFLSFDLSSLPETLVEIEEAQLTVRQIFAGSAYTELGALLWDHVFYDGLDATDFDIAALTASGQILSEDEANGHKTTEVTSAVQADWNNRAARNNRSQYRVRFTESTDNDDDGDIAFFDSGEADTATNKPRLIVTYLTIDTSGGNLCD